MKKLIINTLSILSIVFLQACLKGPHELPGQYGSDEWGIDVNYDLLQLNALQPKEGNPLLIDSDWTVAATVRADDRSGNFSNKIVVEDSFAGITMLIDENSLYSRFPIGRKIYIRLKGLYLGNRKGTLELGAAPAPDNAGLLQVADIAAAQINNCIQAGTGNWLIAPLKTTIRSIQANPSSFVNRLVLLEDIQFDNPYADEIYAQTTSAISIKLRQCSGDTIWLRSSNYALFQPYTTPKGKGTIQAILSDFGGTLQLAIRDTTDVAMLQNRCDGTPIQAPVALSIDSLRKMYQGVDLLLGNYYIYGVVSSDVSNGNFLENTFVMQQGGRGMVVYISSLGASCPQMGDSIRLNISGASLMRYQGVLELSNLKVSKITVLSKNVAIQPVLLNIAQLNMQFADLESVLVRINNAKITSAGNFLGSKTLSDATGNIILYTASSASFATMPVPTITKNFQGIATYYNDTKELKIRNPTVDVQ